MTHPSQPNASALSSFPSLKLFNGASKSAPPIPPVAKPLVSLRAVWEQHVQPDLPHDAAVKTVQGYTDALSHWEALTGDAPVHRISRELLREFQHKLLQGKHSKTGDRSPATVNKILRTIRPLIVRCWPKDSHNPDGLGLIDYFRWPQAIKWQKRIPRVLSDEEITALFNAADAGRWQRRGETRPMADLWRAAMICGFNCGPRVYDLLGWDSSKIDWQFDRGDCPASVQFVAKKTGKTQRLPLNRTVASAIRRILPPPSTIDDQPSTLLWPGWSATNAWQIRSAWKRICEAAGVQCVLEDFRKTCNTRHQANRAGMGPWVLGHSASGVNATNYYDPTEDILRAMATLPQPQVFRDWVAAS